MTTEPDVERFRALLERHFGLWFDDDRLPFLGALLARRCALAGGSPAYFARLERSPSGAELRDLAAEITVPETYFFRNAHSFRALLDTALPERMRAQSATRRLRLLSAGCASGEEPYSLAMLLRDYADAGWDVSIHAFDLNAAMLAKAARGRYGAWALRETPPDMLERWFRADGRQFLLDERVRTMVSFEERNLSREDALFFEAGRFDVIFCRNVLMYFSPDAARAAIARLTRALQPGGFLFLGHAETLRGLSSDYDLRQARGTFYYQKRRDAERPSSTWTPAKLASDAPPATSPPLVLDTNWADAWVEAVRRSSERIAELVEAPGSATAGPATPVPAPVREERMFEAAEPLGARADDAARDPDDLLARAVSLTDGNDLIEAERVCAEMLSRDGTSAAAHYLMALCREGAGDLESAADHDRLAIRIDPTFAMPRMHLGFLARRAGRAEDARRELEQALALLEREDASRVVLFGGGFPREALVGICKSQILACGGLS